MAQMNIESTAGWSYNGRDVVAPICTFRNPSNTEKAEIYSVRLYLGTVRGTCTAGDRAYGDGGAFDTYVNIGGQNSSTLTVSHVVGVTSSSSGSYPNYAQMTERYYDFKFEPAVVILAGTNATISIKTPSTANSKVLALNGKTTFSNGSPNPNGKQITVEYANVPNIAPKPTNVSIICTDYTATRITWKAGCSGNVTNYKVYLDDVIKYSQDTTANSITSSFSVSSSWHSIRVEVKNSNSEWVQSSPVYVDCTIPPIKDPKIEVTTTNKGVLNFTSTYDVRYFLDNTDLGSVKAGTNPKKTVTLKNNTISNYMLKVLRSDNNKIENSRSINNVDSIAAKLVLNAQVQGTSVVYEVTADKVCTVWDYVVYDDNLHIVRNGTVTSKTGTLSIKGTIKGLELNKEYSLQFQAERKDNGVVSKSNTYRFETNGCVRIKVDNSQSWKIGIPYVYDNGKWNQLIPYIWNGTEWIVCS